MSMSKRKLITFILLLCNFLCAGEQKKSVGENGFYLKVKNRFYIGTRHLQSNVFLADSVKLAFQKGFFPVSVLLTDIDIKRGSCKLIGEQGELVLYPSKKFMVVLRTPQYWRSPQLPYFKYFEINNKGIRPLWTTVDASVEHPSYALPPGVNIEKTYLFERLTEDDEYFYVSFRLEKSSDFIGNAKLEISDNSYEANIPPNEFWRIFFNPPPRTSKKGKKK